MDHPFTSKQQLTEQQLNMVNGGNQRIQISATNLGKLKPVIKPAIGSTMALGEEGGFFNNH